jgi:hypothetical protein
MWVTPPDIVPAARAISPDVAIAEHIDPRDDIPGSTTEMTVDTPSTAAPGQAASSSNQVLRALLPLQMNGRGAGNVGLMNLPIKTSRKPIKRQRPMARRCATLWGMIGRCRRCAYLSDHDLQPTIYYNYATPPSQQHHDATTTATPHLTPFAITSVHDNNDH